MCLGWAQLGSEMNITSRTVQDIAGAVSYMRQSSTLTRWERDSRSLHARNRGGCALTRSKPGLPR